MVILVLWIAELINGITLQQKFVLIVLITVDLVLMQLLVTNVLRHLIK